jgi:8-oxo-dGTP pyrophosphatase MutT (NUDIX family)
MIGVIVEREAVKAILLTPQEEVLLLRIRPPKGGDAFWIPPGGGLEQSETPSAGLRRELKEELDLEDFTMGPLLWLRQHTFNWGDKRFCQREQYYVVHVSRFQPRMSDLIEVKSLDRFHWWPLAELESTAERVTPLALARIVSEYLAQGAPSGPLELEVVVD